MSDDNDLIRRGDAIQQATRWLRGMIETDTIGGAIKAIPAVQVTVKPGEIERAVWSAMSWAADNNPGFNGVPEYTDCGNSFAETECRRAAVAEMIRQAVEKEREACAKLVDANAQVFSDVIYINPANEKVFGEHERLLRSIAELIRARGDT